MKECCISGIKGKIKWTEKDIDIEAYLNLPNAHEK